MIEHGVKKIADSAYYNCARLKRPDGEHAISATGNDGVERASFLDLQNGHLICL